MARPAKLNVDYFAHDSGLGNSRQMKSVRSRLGLTGYAIYCLLLEALSKASFLQIRWDETEIELLAFDIGVTVTELNNCLATFEKLGLVVNDSGFLQCPYLDEKSGFVFDKRGTSLVSLRREKIISVAETIVSVTETPISGDICSENHSFGNPEYTKERKGKERKEEREKSPPIGGDDAPRVDLFGEAQTAARGNGEHPEPKPKKKREPFKPPTLDEVIAVHKAKAYWACNPCTFHSYYQSNGWRVGKNIMKDWVAALRGWESRERELKASK